MANIGTVVTRSSQMTLVGYLCLVMLTGCGTFRVEVENPVSPVQFQSPVMAQIAITVVVPPDQFKGDGSAGVNPLVNPEKFQRSLASSLEQVLIVSGVARNVLTHQADGSWKMMVIGKWDGRASGAEYVWTIIKNTFVVILLFIPLFFMSESITVKTEAEVVLTDPLGVERGRFSVQSKLGLEAAFRKASMELFEGMFSVISDDLANRTVLELKRHPHWFEPVR